jgi:hypothetical protein
LNLEKQGGFVRMRCRNSSISCVFATRCRSACTTTIRKCRRGR